ncbi:MAG: ArnT family glycosyltransferase, partial [Candidatus Levyibacteriota bacterium]
MKRYMYLFLLFIVLVAGFFRFFDISNNPPGLYVDEVANGNDAYAILTTGKDMHGVPFPLAFQSLGDYKMPLYIYMTAASMAIFGKNELAVRFPSAIAGTLTVLVFYFFLFELLTLGSHTIISKQTAQKIALLGAFLLAISPWHIHFSRGGFEVTLATFFFLAACWLALLFYKKQSIIYLTISFLLFGSSIYTYFSFKVLSPIIFLFLTIFFYNKYRKLRAKIMFLFILLIFFLLPAILFSFTNNGLQRFSDTSAFSEYPAKTIIKKAVVYPMVFVKNYFSFFSFNFLFRYGDQNGRHQIPNTGLLFWWQLPLLLAGLFSLLHSKQKALKYILLGLLIIVPIPAAFA